MRKVEVGEHCSDEAELETGRDEDFCFAGVGNEFPALGLQSTMLEGADYGGADGYDAALLMNGAIDSGGCRCAQGVALAMKADVFHAIDAEWREGAEADVKGQAGDLNSLCGEGVEDSGREVEAGCGRGDRALLLREDGLIALAISKGVVATDVGRQGHVADAIEDVKEVFGRLELQEAFAEFATVEDFGFEKDFAGWGGKDESLADGYFLAGFDEGAPAV